MSPHGFILSEGYHTCMYLIFVIKKELSICEVSFTLWYNFSPFLYRYRLVLNMKILIVLILSTKIVILFPEVRTYL